MALYQLSPSENARGLLARASDAAWSIMGESLFVKVQTGEPIDFAIPQVSLDEAQRRADASQTISNLLDGIDEAFLSHDEGLTYRLLRYYADCWRQDAERYWLSYDLFGVMFYGPFAQTAYTGGFVFKFIGDGLKTFTFETEQDCFRYLGILSEIERMLVQIHARTEGQAERGIRIHKPQLPGARSFLEGIKQSVNRSYRITVTSLESLLEPHTAAKSINAAVDRIVGRLEELSAQLDEDYEARAPDGVGMDKLPGGKEVYSDLVRLHTTTGMTPEEIHAYGLQQMEDIAVQMQAVRDQLGFEGSASDFLDHLRGHPQARAADADEIAERMRRHRDRFESVFDQHFSQAAPNGCNVARLDPSLEGGMTWGFYNPPTESEPNGIYYYNGSKLDSQAVLAAASLVFHELLPGHHLHLNLQANNQDLSDIRQNAFVNCFNEGWAEYAAHFAGELGFYDNPYDLYGRLLMNSFLTSRLVVDTGMNVLGWSLEEARTFIRENTLCSDIEIETDTLRYSCGIPAQALAYKLGDKKILDLRERMRTALADAFDVKDFHSALLSVGGLPMDALEWHVDWFIEQSLNQA